MTPKVNILGYNNLVAFHLHLRETVLYPEKVSKYFVLHFNFLKYIRKASHNKLLNKSNKFYNNFSYMIG